MTTYPLSEAATVYRVKALSDATSEVLGRGTLEECANIVSGLPSDGRQSVFIKMDDLGLKFGPPEIAELLRFLREESPGLSNNEIVQIKSSGP